MNIALIDKETRACVNVILAESIEAVRSFEDMYDLTEIEEGFWIGDKFENGVWSKQVKVLTEEEKELLHDELSVRYIHEKYSYDEENKIMREYLSDMTNEQCKVAFDTYNTYVEECKARAYTEVYGN